MKRFTWAVASVAAVLASAGLASAASAAPSWQCDASAAWASLAGNPKVNPVTTSSNPCVSDDTGLGNLPSPLGLPLNLLTAQTTQATTTATPAGAASAGQSVSGASHVENLMLGLGLPGIPGLPTLPGLPGLPGVTAATLKLSVANATASAVCQNGQPTLTGSSEVLGASLGGQSVPLDQLATQLSNALGPLGALVDLKVNEQVRDGSSLTQRALHLKLLSVATGTPLLEVVAGEAHASFDAGVCDTSPGPGPGPGPNPGPNPNNGGSSHSDSSASLGVLANGVRGGTCAHLTMRFSPGSKKSITSRYGTRKVVRGRIVNCKGQSIVRARIDVVHIVNGKRKLIKTGLRSREGGKLTLILPRDIKTRDLRFEYRGNLRSAKVTSSSVLHITVRNRAGKVLR